MTVLVRLIVVAALLAVAPPHTVEPAVPATRSHPVDVTRAVSSTIPGGEPSLTQVDIVVPGIDVEGEVRESESLERGRSSPEVIVADQVAGDRVETEVFEAGSFQTVGVTWPEGQQATDLGAQVRARVDGAWSDWVDLEVDDVAPDPGTVDAASSRRGGTEPVWFGESDAVQLAFEASEQGATGLALTLVGTELASVPTAAPASMPAAGATGSAAAAQTTRLVSVVDHGVVPAAASAPRVITRAEWGARAQVCAPDVARSLVGAVVHHTAGSNAYSTVAQAMQQIRNDQSYHIDGRGWCDLGYNFVVDKWGNLYEGRANSLTEAVIGVHAGGFNTGTVGVSMLGTYDAAPPLAMERAVASIIGVRLAAYNVNPQGSMSYTTGAGENARYKNTTVTLPRVFGHRDVSYTACPGNGGMAALPGIRATARTYFDSQQYGASRSVVTALYQDLLGRGPDPTGLAGWTASLMSGTSQSALVNTL
ncbi:N-acetylmuramoyl-L-alanine amidase, partial [Cellulomonas chengniuliangii]